MFRHYQKVTMGLWWFVLCGVTLCSKASKQKADGFQFTEFSNSNMIFLTCDANYLPSDVTAVLSMNIVRRSLRKVDNSEILASMRQFGKCYVCLITHNHNHDHNSGTCMSETTAY